MEKYQHIDGNIQNTLTLLIKDGKILLGDLKYKKDVPEKNIKKGMLKGKMNFPGGKQDLGEDIEETSIREFKEETGLDILNQKKVGLLKFRFEGKGGVDVHIFIATDYKGNIISSNEMNPVFVNIDEIDYTKFWEEDSIWIKKLLNGEQINLKVERDSNGNSKGIKSYNSENYDLNFIKKILKEKESFFDKVMKTFQKKENRKKGKYLYLRYIEKNEKGYSLEDLLFLKDNKLVKEALILKKDGSEEKISFEKKNKKEDMYKIYINNKLILKENTKEKIKNKIIILFNKEYDLIQKNIEINKNANLLLDLSI